jgi:hypothetical protein
VAIDAGIRYVTGEEDQIKFGITLKNVGPTMTYRGDGLALQMLYPETGDLATIEQRSSAFEMPSLLAIGGSYDFNFTEVYKLTLAGAFTANSFSNDQFKLGANFNMNAEKAQFDMSVGYIYEKGIFSKTFDFEGRVTAIIRVHSWAKCQCNRWKEQKHAWASTTLTVMQDHSMDVIP